MTETLHKVTVKGRGKERGITDPNGSVYSLEHKAHGHHGEMGWATGDAIRELGYHDTPCARCGLLIDADEPRTIVGQAKYAHSTWDSARDRMTRAGAQMREYSVRQAWLGYHLSCIASDWGMLEVLICGRFENPEASWPSPNSAVPWPRATPLPSEAHLRKAQDAGTLFELAPEPSWISDRKRKLRDRLEAVIKEKSR